ncbi:MAG: hypothetical protein MUC42_01705 [Bryobacter sp.]|jgi:hypothetical protein|nr:hypothetical protein [Bryobacter sp.]
MRILIDECVDQRIRFLFEDFDCRTAGYSGLAGLSNGALLQAAESAGFDVLITTDQRMPFQQNLEGRSLAILIFCAPTNRLADLKLLVPAARSALMTIGRGEVIRIR